jgi:hypothetical protein
LLPLPAVVLGTVIFQNEFEIPLLQDVVQAHNDTQLIDRNTI